MGGGRHGTEPGKEPWGHPPLNQGSFASSLILPRACVLSAKVHCSSNQIKVASVS